MILLTSAQFPPEPITAATLAYDLAMSLSTRSKVTVITPRPSRPQGFSFQNITHNEGRFEHKVVRSFTCPRSSIAGRALESYSYGRHAVRFIRKHHREIRCIYILAWPLFAQYQIVKAAKRYGIPSVIHVVDIYPESLTNKLPVLKRLANAVLLPIDRYILQNSFRVITISRGMKHMLEKTRNLDSQKVEIVYTWQNDHTFLNYRRSNEKDLSHPAFTFMFLGSLSPTAALDNIVMAFNLSSPPNSRLIIAGNGCEKDSLMSLARDCSNGTIEFWDAPLHKVPEIQDQADVLIISLRKNSAKFAMPSKLPAYMFSRKPIIACVENDSDIAQAIRSSNCGWVVRPEERDDLASVMTDAISRPKHELLSYGDNGYHYALKTFSREKNLNKLVSIIELAHETLL